MTNLFSYSTQNNTLLFSIYTQLVIYKLVDQKDLGFYNKALPFGFYQTLNVRLKSLTITKVPKLFITKCKLVSKD